jgi:hypothetical protein
MLKSSDKLAEDLSGFVIYPAAGVFQPGEPRTRNLFGTDARKPA